MSEPTYGSGQSYDPQGYGGNPYGGQQYGGQQYGGQPSQQPYPSGQQPQQPTYGGYGQPGGYPSGSYPASSSPSGPSAASPSGPASSASPRAAADRFGAAATLLTIIGYVCAGAGVLAFVLWLIADGDGIYRFASALTALVLGLGLGGLNYAVGTWLGHRNSTSV